MNHKVTLSTCNKNNQMAAFIEDSNSIINAMVVELSYSQTADIMKVSFTKIKCKVKVNFTTINMISLIKVNLKHIQVNFFIIVSMDMGYFIITFLKNYKEDLTLPI